MQSILLTTTTLGTKKNGRWTWVTNTNNNSTNINTINNNKNNLYFFLQEVYSRPLLAHSCPTTSHFGLSTRFFLILWPSEQKAELNSSISTYTRSALSKRIFSFAKMWRMNVAICHILRIEIKISSYQSNKILNSWKSQNIISWANFFHLSNKVLINRCELEL